MAKSNINDLYRGSYFWEGVGVDVEERSTLDEILEKSGANFKVNTTRCLGKVDIYNPETDSNEVKEIVARGKKLVYREDTYESLGVVGSSQTIIQNAEVGAIAEQLRNMGHGAWVSVAVNGRGESVFFIQKLEEKCSIKGTTDEVEFFHILLNGHDGTLKLSMAFVPIQVRTKSVVVFDCDVANSYEMKHTKNIDMRIAEASRLLSQSQAYFSNWISEANALADTELKSEQIEEVINYLIPAAPKRQAKADTARNTLIGVYESAYQDLPLLRNTAWHLYSAIAEYADQYRTFKDRTDDDGKGNSRLENRFSTILFRDQLKAKAYKKIKKMI